MKRFLTAILAVILTVQVGISPALAQDIDNSDIVMSGEVTGLSEEELEEEGISGKWKPETENPDGNETKEDSEPGEVSKAISLSYDDRYSFCNDYEGYEISSIENIEITSRKVIGGNVASAYDSAVLTLDAESDTDVIATGVGTAKVKLIKESEVSDEETDNADTSETYIDSANDPDTIIVDVTVSPAPLTLMFVSGQSNAEGWCSAKTGYMREYSIACEKGTVYSTYAPTFYSIADSITGIAFSEYCTQSNAGDFVAEALTANKSLTGKELEYPLNSLTEDGEGKTGIDSGLAYEWNQLTGDKVWIVNAAWGGSSITSWIPGATLYERAKAVYHQVYFTYCAEILAGHYVEDGQLLFWLQGEHDKNMETATYSGYFQNMYNGLMTDFGYLDGIGVISVRSSKGSYTNADELQMTAPRIVQYLAGASDDYEKLYVVSNVNEQWVSNDGVASYFAGKYGDLLSYPMRSTASVPKTMAEVHSDIHYSQIGHNENGITAAEGMYHALQDDEFAQPKGVNWYNSIGEQTSLLYVLLGQAETLVPVADPVYSARKVIYSAYNVNYDAVLGQITGKQCGSASLLAQSGENQISALSMEVSDKWDFTDTVGKDYTDFYYFQGKWYYLKNGMAYLNTNTVAYGTVNGTYGLWYVKNGVVSLTDTVAKNGDGWWYIKDGKVDFDYYGLAENEYGWWRIEAGKVNFDFNGFAENSNGWWYLKGGKVQFETKDVVKGTVNDITGWWYVVGGKVTFTDTVEKNSYGWWRIEEGKVNFDFNGFAENSNGWWYLKDGKVQFASTDVIKGTVNDITGWWYVVGGKVTFTDTVAKNSYGWWRIEEGIVNFDFNGFAENSNGWWYLEDGKVQFASTDVIKGTVNDITGWWYVSGGKVTFTDTVAKNSNGWWYIKNGMVDFGHYGVEKNSNGWWRIEAGKVNFGYNGFAENSYGWWYVSGGKVQFGTNDVIKGTVNGTSGWWYVVGSKVTFTNTVAKNLHGWWYIKNGIVDFSYNGVAKNSNGWWYLKDGKVDFSYNGNVKVSGSIYRVVQGRVYK